MYRLFGAGKVPKDALSNLRVPDCSLTFRCFPGSSDSAGVDAMYQFFYVFFWFPLGFKTTLPIDGSAITIGGKLNGCAVVRKG